MDVDRKETFKLILIIFSIDFYWLGNDFICLCLANVPGWQGEGAFKDFWKQKRETYKWKKKLLS